MLFQRFDDIEIPSIKCINRGKNISTFGKHLHTYQTTKKTLFYFIKKNCLRPNILMNRFDLAFLAFVS